MSERRADQVFAAGRLAKAMQFLRAAEEIMDLADDADDIGDAFVTLCVHAGIAAADVLCAVRLGVYSGGESHGEALRLLRRVRPDGASLAHELSGLLQLKTKAGYTHRPVTGQERTSAGRRARALVEAARAAA